MQQGMTLDALLAEVMRQRDTRRDFVADTGQAVRLVPMPDFPHKLAAVLLKDDAAELERLEITEHAHRQIAARLRIPWKHYYRMLTDHLDIVLDEVNKLFEREPARRLLRTLDGKLRAFLSDRYKRLDNDVVLENILPAVVKGDHKTELLSANVTEQKLYLKVLFPEQEYELGTAPNGKPDVIKPGFSFSNSEIGTGKMAGQAFFFRDYCRNGCVYGKEQAFEFSRVHLGGRLIEGSDYQVVSDETMRKDDAAILSLAQDFVKAASDPTFWAHAVDRLRAIRAGDKIKQPIAAIEELANEVGLKEKESAKALENLIRDQDYSQWGAVNAVTMLANDPEIATYDRASELEQIGQRIIDLPVNSWNRIATAEPVAIAA